MPNDQPQSRYLPSKEWRELWATYFDRRAEDRGALNIGPDERRMLAIALRDAPVSETQPTIPLEPTPAMIEAGAQRLVRWETGAEKWPESWSDMDVRAARKDAERCWRSMHSAAEDAP